TKFLRNPAPREAIITQPQIDQNPVPPHFNPANIWPEADCTALQVYNIKRLEIHCLADTGLPRLCVC
ncbi:MAG: hypothetical protein ABGZ35_28835, partial [Planctomycetaceae bacterium]